MERDEEVINFHKHRVFDRDPFAVDPPPKPHYYPSPERKVKAKQKCIEGKALMEKKPDSQQQANDRLSPMDEFFLKGSNVYQSQRHATRIEDEDDEINFDESWPTSEKPSSLSLSGLEDDSPIDIHRYKATLDKFTNIKKTIKFVDKENQQSAIQQRLRNPGSSSQSHSIGKGRKTETKGSSKIPIKNSKTGKKANETTRNSGGQAENGEGSVLQRYVERFRNSAPMSRDEREKLQNGSSTDFWWMPNKDEVREPSGEISPREVNTNGRKTRKITPLTEENLDKYFSFEGEKKSRYKDWPASPGHKKTVELQEKAEKLLERSSSTVLSTEPAVSTDGLGSNMSDMSSLEEYSYRPPFARYTEKEYIPKPSNETGGQFGAAKTYIHPTRPDEDPLYQWRLRRRMDQAKEAPPTNVSSFGFLTKTEQQRKIDAKLEEFKQRLAGKEPDQPARTKVSHQENKVDQIINSDRSEPPIRPTMSGMLQFTPAPIQTQKDICDKENEIKTPDIASPTLHRRKGRSHDGQHVDPHLHLMCDLLPCPHQNEYTVQYNTHGNDDDDDPKTRKTGESYRQYLEAEKPDVEKKPKERQSEQFTEDVNDVKGRNTRKDLRQVKPDKGRNDHRHEDNLVDNTNFVHVQDQRDNQSDNSDDLPSEQCDIRQRPIEKLNERHRSSERPRSDINEDADVIKSQGSREGGKDNVIKPTHSSSPKIGRRTVDSAIGQAIKDHLFSTTTSTVLSSVDSLPPSASVTRLERKKTKGKQKHSTDEEEYESDGDHPDDHLLQMLRKQRSLFEQQLRQIDHKLKLLEDR